MELMKKVWKVAKVIFAIGSFIWAVGKTIEAKNWKNDWEEAIAERYHAFNALRSIEWHLKNQYCSSDSKMLNGIRQDVADWQSWCKEHEISEWEWTLCD